MKKTTRGIRAAIAAGALGTALFAGVGVGPADAQQWCYDDKGVTRLLPIDCYTTATRPEETTTTTEAVTTTTAVVTTTTEGERPTTSTTMGTTTPTTAAPTTTAPTVGGATGARPVAAQASYTG